VRPNEGADEVGGGLKAVLIGQIITDHDRNRSEKRWFLHKGLERRTLVGPGRLQLDDQMTRLQRQAGFRRESAGQRPGGWGLGRRAAKVQAGRPVLVLNKDPGSIFSELLKGSDSLSNRRHCGHIVQGSVRSPALQSVNPGGRECGTVGNPVDLGDRAAADDGDPPLQAVRQPAQHRRPVRVRLDGIGGGGQRGEDAVQIEKQGRVPEIARG
jgi:hypothetical protein